MKKYLYMKQTLGGFDYHNFIAQLITCTNNSLHNSIEANTKYSCVALTYLCRDVNLQWIRF